MTDKEILEKMEESTKNARVHQLQTLGSILQRQGGVRYLQSHLRGHSAPIDVDTFRKFIPLSCYDDYVDHINEMAKGAVDHDHQPLLSVDPLLCFFTSSGTSSMKPKLIPHFESGLSRAASFIAHQGSGAILQRLFPPRPLVNKIMMLIYADSVTTTEGGFKVMAASSYPLHSSKANLSQFLSCSSPSEVILGSNVEHQMYCHLLCGIAYSNSIDGIRVPYAIGLIRAFYLLESKWQQICNDLEHGFPSSEICDVSMRDSVTKVLGGPQLDLSKRIRSICEENNWSGVVSRLWPNIRFIRCVTTGNMKQYYPKLKYYAGEIPVLGGDYFASECCVGLNLDIMQPPEMTQFVILPTAAYFEFLPFDLDKAYAAGEETVDLAGVEVGKMYEVVVTTYRGLYRYRLGDIVKVTGFYNSSPQVEFVMRAPKTPDEILTERDLMTAMESFQLELRSVMEAEVFEFASFLDSDLSPKQLKVFVEVRGECMFLQGEKLQESVLVLRRCCSSLEDSLGGMYKVQRDKGEVGPLSVSILKPGSFDRLLLVAIEKGAPASQYKPPKIIRNPEIANFLKEYALVAICLDSSAC